MSLLDDVSIVVTPNGYKAGELYAVVPVPTYGAELVTNGDFATDTDWTINTGWTISGGSANCDGNNQKKIYQNIGLAASKSYEYIIDVKTLTSGTITLFYYNGSYQTIAQNLGLGTHNLRFSTSGTPNGSIYVNSNSFIGSVDNVSVKEYTSADMDVTRATAATRVDENGLVNYAEILGSDLVTNGDFATDLSGWNITGNDATHTVTWTASGARFQSDTTSPVMEFKQLNLLTSGKQYVLTCNIAYTGVGQLRVNVGTNLTPFTEGANTKYFTATSSTMSFLRENANLDAIIDDVTVKEVTRDNVPRIDYTGGGCPHILAEPQRTNLIQYSEDITQVNGYSPNGVTLASNQGVTPMGTDNATKLTSTGVDPYIQYEIPNTNTTFTLSVYAKGVGSSVGKDINFYLIRDNYAEAAQSSQFTLTNEWVRYTATLSLSTNPTTKVIYRIDAPSVAETGDEVLIWGTQCEVGSYPTSYIPTSGSTVTRNQDIFTRDGIGSLINSTEGVLFVEMAALSDDGTDRRISLNDGTVGNAINIGLSRFSGNINAEIHSGGSLQTSGWGATGVTQTNNNKFALSWGSGAIKFYVNGSPKSSQTGITSPIGLNSLKLSSGDDTLNLFAKVKQLQVYDTSLSDTQLAALTS